MGNIIYNRPPETSILSAPAFRTPFTDLFSQVGHHYDDDCLSFQLRFIDCCEAYGSGMCREKCKYYYQDFVECSRSWKQLRRVDTMAEQRLHLWFKHFMGKGPAYPLYLETPRYDAYVPHFKYRDTTWD